MEVYTACVGSLRQRRQTSNTTVRWKYKSELKSAKAAGERTHRQSRLRLAGGAEDAGGYSKGRRRGQAAAGNYKSSLHPPELRYKVDCVAATAYQHTRTIKTPPPWPHSSLSSSSCTRSSTTRSRSQPPRVGGRDRDVEGGHTQRGTESAHRADEEHPLLHAVGRDKVRTLHQTHRQRRAASD